MVELQLNYSSSSYTSPPSKSWMTNISKLLKFYLSDLRVQQSSWGVDQRPDQCGVVLGRNNGEESLAGSFSMTQVSIITSSLTMNLTVLCNSCLPLPVSTLPTFHTK